MVSLIVTREKGWYFLLSLELCLQLCRRSFHSIRIGKCRSATWRTGTCYPLLTTLFPYLAADWMKNQIGFALPSSVTAPNQTVFLRNSGGSFIRPVIWKTGMDTCMVHGIYFWEPKDLGRWLHQFLVSCSKAGKREIENGGSMQILRKASRHYVRAACPREIRPLWFPQREELRMWFVNFPQRRYNQCADNSENILIFRRLHLL